MSAVNYVRIEPNEMEAQILDTSTWTMDTTSNITITLPEGYSIGNDMISRDGLDTRSINSEIEELKDQIQILKDEIEQLKMLFLEN